MLQLYYFPDNASLAPHLLWAETHADYSLSLVDRNSNAQKSKEYLKLNPAGHTLHCRCGALKSNLVQIKGFNKGIDNANRIVIVDPVIQPIRKHCRLASSRPFDKAIQQALQPIEGLYLIRPLPHTQDHMQTSFEPR